MKTFSTLAMLLVLLPAPVWAQSAPCPVTPTVLMNAEVLTVFKRIEAAQKAHKAADGRARYFQLLPPITKRDGLSEQRHETRKPTDRDDDPIRLGFQPTDVSYFAYRVDEYRGPLGDGYTANATFERGGTTCTASAVQGPEEFGFPPIATLVAPVWYTVDPAITPEILRTAAPRQ